MGSCWPQTLAHTRIPQTITNHTHPASSYTCRLAEEEDDELDGDDILLARMDAGLYTLQQVGWWMRASVCRRCCVVLLRLWCSPMHNCAQTSCHFRATPTSAPACFAPACLQCALIVGALWLVGDVGVRKRILRLLHQQGRTLASLRSVLLEHRANLGDEGAWLGAWWACWCVPGRAC